MMRWQWRDWNSQPYDCESCILTTAPSQLDKKRYGKFFRRPDPTPVKYAAGRNGGYIRSNTGTVPSVCNEPVTGSQALGSSHRLGRCCLWWTALPSHGIGSASVSLILLLLLTVDSDDWNEVTLLFQSTCIQSYNIADMIRAYSGILHGVRHCMARWH